MAIFSDFLKGFTNSNGYDSGSGSAHYEKEDSLLGLKKPLSYDECRDIYQHWALGKRIAKALPNFAMSADREIIFDDLPLECSKYFKETESKYNINKLVKRIAINIRIFGLAGVFIAHSEKGVGEPLTYDDFQSGNISFNIQDPLTLAGLDVEINPLDINYQKIKNVYIQGTKVHNSRIYIGFNDLSFYMKWVQSTFSFTSPSIYQNMVYLIRSWRRCVTALERMATKAGGIVYKNRNSGSVANSLTIEASRKSLELIRNMENDGIASIEKDSEVEFFNLTGISEVDSILNQMNSIILLALNDTPANILLDKELAKGFGDGSEDMKSTLMAIDDYRKEHLSPIYDFLDKFLLYITFTPAVLQEIIRNNKQDLKGLSIDDLREKIFSSFSFEWGNLYPDTEATKTDNASKKLDNLAKLKGLGANLSDIENILNNDKDLYIEDIELNENNLKDEMPLSDEMLGYNDLANSSETNKDLNKDK